MMRDGLMQGNKEAYECQRDVIATVAEVGTFICTAYTGLKGGVCFVAGTLVLTETGQEPIETIAEGEADLQLLLVPQVRCFLFLITK